MFRRTFNQILLTSLGLVVALRASQASTKNPSPRKPFSQAERWAETISSLLGRRDPLAVSENDMLAKVAPLMPDIKHADGTLEGSSPENGIIDFAATFLQQTNPHILYALAITMPRTDSQGHSLYPPLFRRLSSHLLHTEWRLSYGSKPGSTEARWSHNPDALYMSLAEEGDRLTLKIEEAGERLGGPR